MYEQHFKFSERPFKNIPDTQAFYFSSQHEEALTRMFYTLVEGRGSMLLTGECGCGKTIISRLFYNELRKKRDIYKVALIDNPNLTHIELLKEILYQLGLKTQSNDKVVLLQMLNSFLYENKKQGKETILIVDEVQQIQSKATLEELRLLLNHHQDGSFLLTLYLIGQPEFNDIVKQFPQLDQRLSTRYHITPLSLADTEAYMLIQLKAASKIPQNIFKKDAIKAVYDASRGIPRIINHICDTALLKSYNQLKDFVDKDMVHQVVKNENTAR